MGGRRAQPAATWLRCGDARRRPHRGRRESHADRDREPRARQRAQRLRLGQVKRAPERRHPVGQRIQPHDPAQPRGAPAAGKNAPGRNQIGTRIEFMIRWKPRVDSMRHAIRSPIQLNANAIIAITAIDAAIAAAPR